jgi:hypothetical protein
MCASSILKVMCLQVILYFSNRLDQVQKDLGVSEVLTTIQHGALQWPKERLRVSNSSVFEMHDIHKFYFKLTYVWDAMYQCISRNC